MMNWRIAESLKQLRKQIDKIAPKRDKKSDGAIGNAEHASRESDHNPWFRDKNGVPVVSAIDITHDPQGGMDCNLLAKALIASHDPRIKYVIWNRQICSSKVSPWQWRKYNGKNPHTHHLHISVMSDSHLFDDMREWMLGGIVKKQVFPPMPNIPAPPKTDSFTPFTPEEINEVVNNLNPNSTATPEVAASNTPSNSLPDPVELPDGGGQKPSSGDNFTPKDIPAFLPRLGKLKYFGIAPVLSFLATVWAWLDRAPWVVIFALGFVTGALCFGFAQILIAHRRTVGQLLIRCYESLANPSENNLIPSNPQNFKGSRADEIMRALD